MVISNKYTQHTKKVLIITKIQDRLTWFLKTTEYNVLNNKKETLDLRL